MDKNSAILGVFLLAVFGMLVRPLVLAWSRRISGTSVSAEMTRELDELRQRVAELEGGGMRMQELEERVDFAERLLAQRGDASIPPPNGGVR
jgi:hypothetical protein